MSRAIQQAGRIFALVCIAIGAAAPAANAALILYEQVADFPGPSSFRTSYGIPGQSFFRTFDNFTLIESGLVTEVTWQGSYSDFVDLTNNPATPNTVSFELAFWSDASGEPGALLLSQTFPIAAVDVTFVGLSPTNRNVFNYGLDLTVPFLAQAGTSYWLSIFSNSSSFTPLWGWRTGSGGDGMSFQENLATGSEGPVDLDRAFSLSGQPGVVPEPSSILLLISGLAGAALWARRRACPWRILRA